MSTFPKENLADALALYAVTDRQWLGQRSLAQCVKQAIEGGATFIQLREKDAPYEEKRALAEELLAICEDSGVPFVIDDDVALAKEVGAHGVHVGQDDESCAVAREILGPDAIIGVSAQTVEQALEAQAAGADHLGVGALVPTSTKPDAVDVTPERLRAICDAVDIPVIGIGGLNAQTIPQFAGLGLAGVAVVSAIFAEDDCKQAAAELKDIVQEVIL